VALAAVSRAKWGTPWNMNGLSKSLKACETVGADITLLQVGFLL
jgi:hypothetical protein